MWTRKIGPTLLFFGSLVLYLYTLAPTVTFVDSGELIVAARNLGVAHPPGFPLYVLITHLFTLLPFGNVAQRVHFGSALWAALAVSVTYLIAIEVIDLLRASAPSKPAGRKKQHIRPASLPDKYLFIPGVVSAGLVAFSRTLWSYATLAEVYTLNTLLILLTFLILLRWRRAVLADKEQGRMQDSRKTGASDVIPGRKYNAVRLIYLCAFLFGLALGVHHLTVLLLLPSFIWIVYRAGGIEFFKSRRFVLAALACLLGCMIYAYLPWAASNDPTLNWGNPSTLEGFWSHVTGKQYQSNLSFSSDQTQREAAFLTNLITRQFGWPWLPAVLLLACIGLVWLYRKDRDLLISFFLVGCCNLLLGLGYEISEDKDAYYLPTLMILAISAGLGIWALLGFGRGRNLLLATGAGTLSLVAAFTGNFRHGNRSDFCVAQDYVHNIFQSIDPQGLLLTGDWQVASPMLYFQELEHQRPDLVLIDTLLLRRSWYFDHLKARYPLLMEQSRPQVQAFLEDLTRWERDPEAFEQDPGLVKRIESRYQGMIDSLIQNHLSKGPVFATQDVVLSPDPGGRALAGTLMAKYEIVPGGLVFRLFPDRGAHSVTLPRLETRGLAGGSHSVKEDPVVRQKVIPVYVTMLVNCGRAFSARGDEKRAMDAYRRAWAIDSVMVVEQNLLPPGVKF